MGWVVGSESRSLLGFLLRVSEFPILDKLPGNGQLYAGSTSECAWVECGAWLHFNLALGVPAVLHYHFGTRRADKDAQRCCMVHDFAYVSKRRHSHDPAPGPALFLWRES